MADTTSEPRIDTTRLQGIARAYTQSAVFYAALDVELFTHIHHGATTEGALASATTLRSPLICRTSDVNSATYDKWRVCLGERLSEEEMRAQVNGL